jgi:hypothetical protein
MYESSKVKSPPGGRAGCKSLLADQNANSPGLNHRMMVMVVAGMRIDVHQNVSISGRLTVPSMADEFTNIFV